MSWMLALMLFVGSNDLTAVQRAPTPESCSALAVRCHWECVCFRTNGYRCRRYYTEACNGKACWQCQAQVTERARKSCAIGSPIKSCWCKFNKL